ncbi:dynein heavy chain 7, axonemal-like [Copidosoma floridanum]|uniref:dynein heavy chain 7, axonemal-like n=1 Tax=Copidosoma floridanum TaxID=29053 RepID=UPI0006C9D6DF|nr:dynein heavy chain 7, axonemal-like [Copidosoma floridanum]
MDFAKSEHLERNPLQKFRAQAMRFVKPRPTPQTSNNKLTDKWRASVHRISKTLYQEELIKLAKSIHVQGLLSEWEENILKLIPRTSKRKHIMFLMGVMKEVRQDYLREMQDLSARSIVRVANGSEPISAESPKAIRRASTEDFGLTFHANRKLLNKRYLLSHRLIRSIANIMHYNLPRSFINFDKYKAVEGAHVSRLSDMMNGDVQRCGVIVQNQCYNEIVKHMLQMTHLKDDRRLPRLLHCAESFMAQQILNSMMKSIDGLIDALRGPGGCWARLKLTLLCRNDGIELEPSIDDVFAAYHRVVDGVGSVAQELVPLGEWLKVMDDGKRRYIKVALPAWFLKRAHEDLQEVLEGCFQSLHEHHEFASARFNLLCSSKTRRQINRLIASRRNFDVYCAEVRKFNGYLKEVADLAPSVYYDFGTLDQSVAICDLKQNASEIIGILVGVLLDNHQELNRSICAEFENLESRALAIPDDTKSLFELTDYVSHASKVLVKELEEKIRRSVGMLSSLLELAVLSNEHVELNRTTINWLELIKPVFSQHNIFCEAKKGELEDELQKKVNTLNGEVDAIFPELVIINDMDDANRILEYKEFLISILKKISLLDNHISGINNEEKLFKFPETTFPKVDEVKEVMSSFCSLIHVISQWQRNYGVWMDGPFEYLDAQLIREKTDSYFNKITEMHRAYKVKIKSDLTSNKPFKFSGIVDDPDPMQQPAPLKLCWQALRDLSEFKKYVPLAICMCNPALEKRHWDEMSSIAGINLLPNAGTTLRKMIDIDLLRDYDKYHVISLGANKELALSRLLNSMIGKWSSVSFSMTVDEASNFPVFADEDQIEILLEEHFVEIKKMRASYFIAPIETKIVDFYKKLCCVRDTIELWNAVQEQCTYLNPFFIHQTVQSNLATAVELYNFVVFMLKSIKEAVASTPTFDFITQTSSALDKLKEGMYAAELIRGKVRSYLDGLRLSFNRFFFVSDGEMMKLLFEHQCVTEANSHLQKCFPNVVQVKMDQQSNIVSIVGEDGEELKLENVVSVVSNVGSVTDWLVTLDKEIGCTIKYKIVKSLEVFNDEVSLSCISSNPAMVTFCTWQIIWTSQIHNCFILSNSEALKVCRNKFNEYKESARQLLKLSLSRKDRETVTSLIVLLIHQEEVINLLVEKKVHDDADFDWKAQVRYYCQDEQVKVFIINTCINYAYEYYSSNQKILVNTPLTERCYRSLMEAANQNYYGKIVGFSGTGKTETIKNLARTLAKPMFVFQGDDRQDYNCMINAFKGLVTLDVWVFLKNFTTIKEEVLSVIAQYIFRIFQTKIMNLTTINIDGAHLDFNPNSHLSISVNPTIPKLFNLPDNLRLHFRTVCFMNPDAEKICQIELFAAGFDDAKNLATAINEVYDLCNDLMSSRKTYNLKLRSMKCVVARAAQLKFASPDEDEQTLLFRSLIDVNIPQLAANDIVIFRNVLSTIFPGAVLPPPNHDNLLEAVKKICADEHLSNHDVLKSKVAQLYEMLNVRRAIILVGDACSGKSTILRVLKEALTLLHNQDNQDDNFVVSCEVVNAGALSVDRLYGYTDKGTGKWIDGVCASALRRLVEKDNSECKWLIFDGNLSGSWTEKLETVLDDDKTLFLTSYERIVLSKEVHIFFETSTLQDALPSTISRCGVVHLDSRAIGWRPFLLADIISVEQFCGHEKQIYALFDWTVDPCLEFMRNNRCTVGLALTDLHLVMSTLDLFKMYMNLAFEDNLDRKEKDYIAVWSQAAVIMAINWALAGTLDFESKVRFEEFFAALWNNLNERYPRPPEIKQLEVALPTEGRLQDNVYVFKGAGNWKNCGDILKTEKIQEDVSFQEIFIPTIDSLKLSMILNLHLKNRKPFILCGQSSSGKTAFLRNYHANVSTLEYIMNFFNFDYLTGSDKAQELFLSKLNKIKHYDYRPSKNRCCVHLIDDFNAIPGSDVDSNSTTELIRQYMDYGFWYDMKRVKKVTVTNVLFGAAMTTGREKLGACPRFLRHFNVFAMYAQTKDSMFRIFSNSLTIGLKNNSFAPDIASSVTSIVNATLEVYQATVQELRPVPTKPLYCFSMRDVQRIVNGCSLIHKESVENKVTFIRLWAHEAFRVLTDRINDNEDKQWLFSKIRESVKMYFKDTFESVFDNLPKYGDNELTLDSFQNLAFGNFVDLYKSKRRYEEISSFEQLKNKCLQYLGEFNESNDKKLDMVVTCHVLQHLVRICRVLATAGGSMLMISSSGTGRKSLARLAAHIQRQHLFEPTMDTEYNETCWRNDIKAMLLDCGTLKKDNVFLMSDRQMRPEFARDISSLLSFGEIPMLFSDDEQRDIIKKVRLDAQNGNRNLELKMSSIFDYFLYQCKQKLHVILNVGLTRKNSLDYLHKYPALIDKCTINWLDPWPEKALEQVATWYTRDTSIQDSVKQQLILASKHCHGRMRQISTSYYEETGIMSHVTPVSFARTIKLCVKIISDKQREIKATRKRYLSGLDKLQLAAREVAQMKNTLTKLRPQLEASARETEETMKEIENENLSVEKTTVLVKRDEEVANKKAEIAGILRTECESELAVAIPILEDAIAALNTLKPTDITLVKAMKNPPDTVKLVMAAVCVMLGVPSERVIDSVTGRKTMDYWGPSKRVLGDMNFLQNLKDYDKDNISPAIMATIKKTYMSDKNFMPHIVAKASSAAEGLCKWVRAMVSYDEVAKVVAPKKEKLAAAQKECDETEAFLNAKRNTLAELNRKLAVLKSTLQATLLKKLELEREVKDCTVKLKKAEGLISSLSGEKTRWLDSANKLGRSYDSLAGDAFMSSTVITYLSSFNLVYREKVITEWKEFMKVYNVPFSDDYDFIGFLGNEVKINAWQLCGLSNNRFSLQNAIIMDNSPLWCLFVDPQAQANEWIRNMEKPNNLQVLKVTDANLMKSIQQHVESGNPVLLENLDKEISVSVDPILTRYVYELSETPYINLGRENMLYKPSFRFYFTTRHHKPCYSADIFNKVTVIDFLLPSDALRDRLLDIVISRERPELQEKFEKVLAENINNKRILEQQEDNILHVLTTSSTNILEDEGAIKILDSSKSLAEDLTKRQQATRISKEEIDAFRETYAQFTKYCADLYSTLNVLPNLNHMYRFSLAWFTQLYIKSIETSNRSVIHKKRIDYLKMSSIQNLHLSVQNALLDRHKLIYSFLLCAKTLMDTEQVTEQEFNVFMNLDGKYFTRDNATISSNNNNPAPQWLSDKSWKEVCKISNSLGVFQNFANSFSTNIAKWKKSCNSIDCDDFCIPPPWDNKLTTFQKLIVTRILCPGRIIAKITEFVESVVGYGNGSFVPNNVTRPYAESSCFTPLLFILPSYSSPFAIVNKLAKVLGYSAKLHVLSMGPSQGQKAELLIEMGRKNGEWVFLHNCHLALTWMTKFEKMCEEFTVSNTNLGFRLWMSAQTDDKFPIGILQNSIKIAFDFPQDVKQTLTWSYKSEPIKDKDFFEGCPGKDKTFSKLLYGFCLFHAFVRERRHFGSQGWNFKCDFDESDLQMSITQLKNWINQCDKVPFKALNYFLSECNYGGKIMDVRDKIYLDTLLLDFCNFRVISDSNYDFDTVFAYRVPKRIEYRDYLKHIRNTIPANTSPEDVGLDKNVALLKNKNFNIRAVEEKYPIMESDSLNCVLVEEVKMYNKCLNVVRDTLNELKTALSGHLVWSERMEDISEEILKESVPKSWKIHVSLCTKHVLSKFITDLLERVKFINSWIVNGHPNFYWFGGLMSCERLLSTMKVIFAKQKQVPIDQVGFDFSVLDIKEPSDNFEVPENTVCVYGLYMVGAKWNEQSKSINDPKTKVFYNEMPVISFELTLKKNINSVNSYKCPVYVSPSLHNSECNSEDLFDNYVLSVNLKSDVNPKIWIKRGVALYCQVE